MKNDQKINQENIFRLERNLIKERFIGSFTASKFIKDFYVKTSVPQSWLPTNPDSKVQTITVSDYEKTISKFIENPVEEINHPLLIIIGGIGTGKSTTIQFALEDANICLGCAPKELCSGDHPLMIYIDFFKEESEVDKPAAADNIEDLEIEYEDKPQITESDFWLFIKQALDIFIDDNLEPNEEITKFWPWLLGDPKRLVFDELYAKLHHNKYLFKDIASNSTQLYKIRNDIFLEFSSENVCKYKLLQLAYIRRNVEGKCNLLIFDNIDSLPPRLQRKTITFALKACQILNSKAILPMRPHTFELNNHAASFMEVIDHWTPDIFDVLIRRNEIFSTYNQTASNISVYMKKLIDVISVNSYRKEIFLATSGSSSRFALRNLYNLMVSPLIVTSNNFKCCETMGSNEFYYAFFCSEVSYQRMYERNFTNLFNLRINHRSSYYSNIKLRIIYFLQKAENKGLMIKTLTSELLNYGYEEIEIISAINDLMLNRKPIIWSNNVLQYDQNNIFHNHYILITPLGIEYYQKALKHIYYFRECIVSQDKKREYKMQNWLIRCREVLYKLESLDYKETYHYLTQMPEDSYKMYHDGYNSITSILWSKLHDSLVNFSRISGVTFDLLHEEYIKNNIKRMGNNKKLSEDVESLIFKNLDPLDSDSNRSKYIMSASLHIFSEDEETTSYLSDLVIKINRGIDSHNMKEDEFIVIYYSKDEATKVLITLLDQLYRLHPELIGAENGVCFNDGILHFKYAEVWVS